MSGIKPPLSAGRLSVGLGIGNHICTRTCLWLHSCHIAVAILINCCEGVLCCLRFEVHPSPGQLKKNRYLHRCSFHCVGIVVHNLHQPPILFPRVSQKFTPKNWFCAWLKGVWWDTGSAYSHNKLYNYSRFVTGHGSICLHHHNRQTKHNSCEHLRCRSCPPKWGTRYSCANAWNILKCTDLFFGSEQGFLVSEHTANCYSSVKQNVPCISCPWQDSWRVPVTGLWMKSWYLHSTRRVLEEFSKGWRVWRRKGVPKGVPVAYSMSVQLITPSRLRLQYIVFTGWTTSLYMFAVPTVCV